MNEPFDGHTLDAEVDVYVTGGLMNGVIVEVIRGSRISHARQFGVDWDGPIHTAMHGSVFEQLSQRSLADRADQALCDASDPQVSTWRAVIAVAVGVVAHNRIACAFVLCVCVWYLWAWVR